MLPEDDMPALLSADQVIISLHVLIDIAVTDGSLFIIDSGSVQRLVQSEITHNCGDDGVARQLSPALHIFGADIHNLVAVHFIAVFIYSQAAVCVSVKCKADIQLVLTDIFLQALQVRASAVLVDVQSVRLVMDHIGFRAQRVEYRRTDHPAGSVGAVQCDLMIVERPYGQVRQISDIAVSPGIEVHRTSDSVTGSEWNLFSFAVNVLFDFILKIVIHFLPVAVHQLDSVVIVRIVACGNHYAAVKPFSPGDIADARGRRDMKQVYIRAGGSDSCSQRILIHIGGTARIFADHNLCFVIQMLFREIPSEKPSGPERMFRSQVHTGFAPESVCSEILAHRAPPFFTCADLVNALNNQMYYNVLFQVCQE